MEKISEIKGRVLQFIETKGISKANFCKETGISYGNMKGNSLKSELGGEQISSILESFSEISPDWLLTGKGEMLRNKASKDKPEDNPLHIDIEAVKMLIAEKDRTIAKLEEQLDKKDQQIDRLIQALSTPH